MPHFGHSFLWHLNSDTSDSRSGNTVELASNATRVAGKIVSLVVVVVVVVVLVVVVVVVVVAVLKRVPL